MTPAAIIENVQAFLDHFDEASDRAVAIHLAIVDVAARTRRNLAVLSELCALAHDEGVWSKVKDGQGRPFLSEDAFYESLGLGSWRSFYRHIAAGRLIRALPDGADREEARAFVAADRGGVAKAAILAPVVAAAPAAERSRWFARARAESIDDLQRHVSDEVQGRAGGFDQGPGERFMRMLLTNLPADAREHVERVFRLAGRVAETRNPVRIFILAVEALERDLLDQGHEA